MYSTRDKRVPAAHASRPASALSGFTGERRCDVRAGRVPVACRLAFGVRGFAVEFCGQLGVSGVRTCSCSASALVCSFIDATVSPNRYHVGACGGGGGFGFSMDRREFASTWLWWPLGFGLMVETARITLSRSWRWAIGVVVVIVVFVVGFFVGRATQIPFSTAWWKDFAQPVATGTAGVFALSAGFAALFGSHLLSSRSHNAAMTAIEHQDETSKIDHLWKRFEWVVKIVGDAAAGSPQLLDELQVSEMVVSIRDAAKAAHDEHLASMLNVFMGEQQGEIAVEIGLLDDNVPSAPDNGGRPEESI